uniref:Vacuolar protein sorting-associated protein 41 homolog n=1 Tax=Steinernema glaseri TaxID=37863 RepID=A0A1I7YG52_9BILA
MVQSPDVERLLNVSLIPTDVMGLMMERKLYQMNIPGITKKNTEKLLEIIVRNMAKAALALRNGQSVSNINNVLIPWDNVPPGMVNDLFKGYTLPFLTVEETGAIRDYYLGELSGAVHITHDGTAVPTKDAQQTISAAVELLKYFPSTFDYNEIPKLEFRQLMTNELKDYSKLPYEKLNHRFTWRAPSVYHAVRIASLRACYRSALKTMAAAENGHEDHVVDVSEDESDGLLEPKFNYERVLNGLGTIFAKDAASCIAVFDKFLAIGTQRGFVHICDHDGHVHSTSHSHRCAVGGIAIDKPGNYVISCAYDSQISIIGFGSSEYNQNVYIGTSAKCVAISEDYSRPNSGQRYVTGNTNVTLHEKGYIHKNKEKRLYQGFEKDGLIAAVSWNGNFIAFTNDTGTRVYDLELEKIITLVQPLHDVRMMPTSKFRPSHCWLDNKTLAIGWANTIEVVSISTTKVPSRRSPQLFEKRGAISYRWNSIPVHIAGISCTVDEDQMWKDLVVFGIKANDEECYPSDDTSSFCSSRLSNEGTVSDVLLQVLEPLAIDQYAVVTEDEIKMHGSSRLTLTKFQMGAIPTDSIFFLLASKELIRAMASSVDDHIKWCLEKRHYEDAMFYAREHSNQLLEYSVLEVGKIYIDHLIEQEKFDCAVQHISEVCSNHKEEWEYYVNEFERHNKILLLAPYLPINNPQLEPECYELVLTSSLFSSVKLFKHFVTDWNPDIYRVGAIIDMTYKRYNRVQDIPECPPLTKEDEAALLVSLAHLYTYDRKYDTALKLHMALCDKAVFPLIEKYGLFSLVKDKIVDLMNIDQNKALRLLIQNENQMPSKDVMRQLSREPKLQMLYLNRLLARNEGAEFADLAVQLYSEYDRAKLMPFLKKHENYRIDKALRICEHKKYMEEVAFLLGRSGKRMEAVAVMVEKMGRMDKAIEFCRNYEGDVELWDYLIELALRTADHINQLLNTSGLCIDPLKIVKKIPHHMDIPGLRDSLVLILRDNEATLNLQRGYQLVTQDDVCSLFDNYIAELSASVNITQFTECAVCCSPLFIQGKEDVHSSVKSFGCGHIAHKHCCDEFYKDNENVEEPMMRGRRSLSFAGELSGGVCPICSNDVSVENG